MAEKATVGKHLIVKRPRNEFMTSDINLINIL